MPRKRRSRLPSAVFKVLLPRSVRRKRRRAKPAPIVLPKAVRSTAKAATAGVRAAVGQPTAKPAKRAAPARRPTRTPTRTAQRTSSGALTGSGRGTWRQGRFSGAAGSRSYRVYLPQGLRKSAKVPLLLALHGCAQKGQDFATGTRFNDLADKHKFLVVYPEQSVAHNVQRCWNWFRPGHQSRAQGEPAILAGIVRQVQEQSTLWRIDPSRVYVAGISAGGAMAVVLAATYPELFAAVGVHSAPPYRSASGPVNALAAMQGASARGGGRHASSPGPSAGPMPPMIVFQGSADGTVRSANAHRIADQWLASHRRYTGDSAPAPVGEPRVASIVPARPVSARSRRGYRVSRWYSGGRKVLEVWIVDGLGHAWSGGSADGSYTDTRGPRATTEMWKFFSAQRSATAAVELAS